MFGLLVKAAVAREARRGPFRLMMQHLAVPVGVVWFVTFLDAEVTADGAWPMLAIALAVWLLFANSVTQAGMARWHERWLLDGSCTPPWLLATAAAVVPVAIFAIHLAAFDLAIAMSSTPYGTATVGLLLPAAMALATGLGLGILAARSCDLRPRFVAAVPALVLGSLVLTPVLYPLSALDGAGDTWCIMNPVCAAVEFARADVADAPSPLSDASEIVGVGVSLALLGGGFLVVGRRRRIAGPRPDRPALALTHVTSGTTLHDVTLTLDRGEILTVVGAPGSGQTTLLRVAAGRPRPSAGDIDANGGTASLIDPRSGFHSALSGRDNLMLRALTEGTPERDARTQTELAVDFGGFGERADTPFSRYSAEERIRLAFVAMAFFTATVLLWDDDVLRAAPAFRPQCLALIPQLLNEGRAVLMVSGDLGKIEELGARSVWLDDGRIRDVGPSALVLARFVEPGVRTGPPDPPGATAACRLAAVHLLDDDGEPASHYLPGDPITIALDLEVEARIESPFLLIGIAGEFGPITAAETILDGVRPPALEGRARVECRFEGLTLAPGHTFTVRFAMYANDRRTALRPKSVIATFVMGGSAATCGFSEETAQSRILGTAPVLTRHSWVLPDPPPAGPGPSATGE